MGSVEPHQAEELIHFYIKHLPYRTDREARLREEIPKHIDYKTIEAVYHQGELYGVSRYNISRDAKEINVLETVIKPKVNGRKVIRSMVASAWQRYPTLEQLIFEREMKYNRPSRTHKISKFFNKGNT